MKVILTVFLILISSSNAFSKELEYSTEKVRVMWYMCSTQFQMVAPHITQGERVKLCDCYVDHMRKTYTPEQVLALTPEQSKVLGLAMKTICPTQSPFTTKEVI